jgi:hypothetical protein
MIKIEHKTFSNLFIIKRLVAQAILENDYNGQEDMYGSSSWQVR